jgi:hypothetical protein
MIIEVAVEKNPSRDLSPSFMKAVKKKIEK